MTATSLTQPYLHSLLDYDPLTGGFTWLVSRTGTFIGRKPNAVNSGGYRSLTIDGISYKQHNLAWFWVHGRWPEGELDHQNRVNHDNRIENLVEGSHGQNMQNKRRYKNNSSGHVGVYRRVNGMWGAQINIEGRRHYLGQHATIDAAVAARGAASARHAFHINHGVDLPGGVA